MTRRATGWRAAAAFLFLVLRLTWPTSMAWAHASLLSSDPADGSALRVAPTAVTLNFDEGVKLVSLRLVGPGGADIPPRSPPSMKGSVLQASYPPDLPPGVYLLSYRVISADSHPLTGTVAFGLGPAGTGVRAAASKASIGANAWVMPTQAARWVFYAAVVVVAGGALFRRWVMDVNFRLRRALQAIALGGVLAAMLQIGLRGAMLVDAPFSGLLDIGVWQLGAGTTLAVSLFVSAVGLLGCAAAFGGVGQAWRWIGLASALVVVAGFPLSGHAASAELRWLVAFALTVHMLAVVYWLGAFWPLVGVLRGTSEMVVAVHRFSKLAVPAVALLLASGSALALVQAGYTASLVESKYGLLIAGKITLLLPLIALAAWNRLRLTPQLKAGVPGAPKQLRRIIRAEAVIGGLILAVTSILSLTPPPRALMLADPASASQDAARHVHRAGRGARLVARERGVRMLATVAPAQAGLNRVQVTFDKIDGELPVPREVWLQLSQAAAGVAPIRRQMQLDAAGGWTYQGTELAIPGRWTLGVEVLLTEFEQLNLRSAVIIR